MPTNIAVNLQQVLQMGSNTEKVQQTTPSLSNTAAQQLNKEREISDEIKRTQIQELGSTYFIEKTDPKTGEKKRIRILKKKIKNESDKLNPDKNLPPESHYGSRVNIQI